MNMRNVHVTLKRVCSFTLALIPLVAVAGPPHHAEADRPRVVSTADPELDDNNTIIRAILYSSDVRLEGLIYVSSQFHWRGDGRGTSQYIAGREWTSVRLRYWATSLSVMWATRLRWAPVAWTRRFPFCTERPPPSQAQRTL
jgi:hypothetical protein